MCPSLGTKLNSCLAQDVVVKSDNLFGLVECATVCTLHPGVCHAGVSDSVCHLCQIPCTGIYELLHYVVTGDKIGGDDERTT